ncbi:uncharacterized protein LOC129775370 [Toxorhynchites rutilus septentrionalis]|uniref:uncharacterized protein LOC129775370 n=1 Tax=Toxorhynchites rutilus septentrionalis TaxID=329112 RepID=UPI00247A83BF|nr:uncharacterized protein LOC129775370 [Toxorhynchites rutilus septentrionalis]
MGKKTIFWSVLLLLVPVTLSSGSAKNHKCIPTGYTNICILEYVYYNRSVTTQHIFPQGYQHIRIGNSAWRNGIESVIPSFDAKIFAEMGRPQAIELMNVLMTDLEIPRKLSFGNFGDNNLKYFTVEHDDSTEPMLTYLDLSRNSLTKLTNITTLVELEALYLYNNRLDSLEPDMLRKLTKLKILDLNYNNIVQLCGDCLPQSLTHLRLYYNDLKKLNYSGLSLPSLEILNIEQNKLTSFDASALVLAMPKLTYISLSGNDFGKEVLLKALEIFDRHNISHIAEGDEVSCFYGDELVEGVCVNRHVMSGSGWVRGTLLTILTLLIGFIFLLVVRWVFIAMNK